MGKKNIGRKRRKKGVKGDIKKENDKISIRDSFKDTQSFVMWVIGMIIAYALGIWCMVLAYEFKSSRDEYMFWTLFVVGGIIVLTLTAFLLAAISVHIMAIVIGIVLFLMGLVLPIVSGRYIAIIFTAFIWIGGILIIIDNIAELTHTKDRQYYKVIFGAARKMADFFFNWRTGRNPKAKKLAREAVTVSDLISNFRRILVKVGEIIMLLVLVAYTCVNILVGDIPSAIFTAACAAFVLFIMIRFK